MGNSFSSNTTFSWDKLQYPTLPEAPYVTFNSAVAVLSSAVLAANWAYCIQKYKDLPSSLPIKIFQKQKINFNLNKRFLFGLPVGGTYGLIWGAFIAANTHLVPYPIEFTKASREKVDNLIGNFIYYGILLSQISLVQNSLRLIHPDKIGTTWFKSFYFVLTAGSTLGYAVVGYSFYDIIRQQNIAARQQMESLV